jgi:hypothetical protein
MKYLIEYLHSYAVEISVNVSSSSMLRHKLRTGSHRSSDSLIVMYVPIRERQLNIISVQHKNLRILFNKDIT